MKHYPRLMGQARTFTDTATIQCEGPSKGFGSDFAVLVEFSAERDWYDPDTGCGEGGEREILDVRWIVWDAGKPGVIKETKPLPDFMLPYIKDCIDVDSLEADWSEF